MLYFRHKTTKIKFKKVGEGFVFYPPTQLLLFLFNLNVFFTPTKDTFHSLGRRLRLNQGHFPVYPLVTEVWKRAWKLILDQNSWATWPLSSFPQLHRRLFLWHFFLCTQSARWLREWLQCNNYGCNVLLTILSWACTKKCEESSLNAKFAHVKDQKLKI